MNKALGYKKQGDLPALPFCKKGNSKDQLIAIRQLIGYELASGLDRDLLKGVLDSDGAKEKTQSYE